jgi:predicted small secreted protein
MRSPLPLKRSAIFALLATAVLLSGCTPDTTRGRVEDDFAQTFSNQYAQSLQRQGKPVARPRVTSTECHNGTNLKADSGPGSWACEIKYVAPDGKKVDEQWLMLVDALGCYQAFTQDDKKRYHEIRDVYSHKSILDPAGSFDGCYDVYSGRTNTSKK